MQPNAGQSQRGPNWAGIIGGCGCLAFAGFIGACVVALALFVFLAPKAQAGSKTIPAPAEQVRLSEDTLLAFNRAVQAGDFTEFHGGISKTWQGQITPDGFKNAFQAFIDRQINIEPLITAGEPTWDRPARISSEGLLQLAGHYRQDSVQATFELDYIHENGSWKLLRIQVVVAPVS